MCSNWVGSGLVLKFYDQTGKGFQGQTLILLGLVISDEGKKFYNIDTWCQFYENFFFFVSDVEPK
jgi:hypothetical protein